MLRKKSLWLPISFGETGGEWSDEYNFSSKYNTHDLGEGIFPSNFIN
jgi:hypothetical protein